MAAAAEVGDDPGDREHHACREGGFPRPRLKQGQGQEPPERRRELQQKLQQYRSLPPEQRQQLRDRYQAFSQLLPEQQSHARQLFRQFNSLPEDRRPIVRREYEQLRSMSEPERNAHMNSEAFRSRFNPAEQQMLQDLARTFGSSP